MAVQGTNNYVYFIDQSLGVGATGNVYLGRHKRQGVLCACKVFRSDGVSSREQIARQREFDVMKKLSHENIVKFKAIEQESRGQAKILIMEYCSGGSVYKMLEDPNNAFGFPEEEFMVFLQDITKALEYLRNSGIVHRDIKPGNILRCIGEDLKSIYKLTDFGAARQLSDDGEFTSLYGTEEYLHPEVYSRALLGTRRYDPLNASIDLWSLGVTIYHVSTGRLPFQSFGGRSNKEDMHKIISRKKSGFISGIQRTKDGDVEWEKELPRTCILSRGLRRHLEKILAGLMETDDRKQWSFESFFNESKCLTSRQPLHVFNVSAGCSERLYLTSSDMTLPHVQDELGSLINLPAARQCLKHSRTPVQQMIPTVRQRGSTSSDCQLGEPSTDRTTSDFPIFVIPTSYIESEWQAVRVELPKYPEVPGSTSVSEDLSIARSACGYVIYLRRLIKNFIKAQSLTVDCVKHLTDSLVNDGQNVHTCAHLLKSLGLPTKRFRTKSCVSLAQTCSDSSPHDDSPDALLAKVLDASQSVNGQLFTGFLEATSKWVCRPEHRCLNILKRSQQELLKIYEDFKVHKQKDLSYNEQQIHKFDRMRITSLVKKASSHFEGHCHSNIRSFVRATGQWYSCTFLKNKQLVEDLEEMLKDLIGKCSVPVVNDTMMQPDRPVGLATPTCVTRNPISMHTQQMDIRTAVDTLNGYSCIQLTSDLTGRLDDIELDETSLNGHQKTARPVEHSDDSGIAELAGSLRRKLFENCQILKETVNCLDKNTSRLENFCSAR